MINNQKLTELKFEEQTVIKGGNLLDLVNDVVYAYKAVKNFVGSLGSHQA